MKLQKINIYMIMLLMLQDHLASTFLLKEIQSKIPKCPRDR